MSEYQYQQDEQEQRKATERHEDQRSQLKDLDPQEQSDNVAGGGKVNVPSPPQR